MPDCTPLEAGLARFVNFGKPRGCHGKAAMLNERQQGSRRQFVTLVVDAAARDVPCSSAVLHKDENALYVSRVLHKGETVGETTSGDWGDRVNASVAPDMVQADPALLGTGLEVDIFGKSHPRRVQPNGPLRDPGNERLRA